MDSLSELFESLDLFNEEEDLINSFLMMYRIDLVNYTASTSCYLLSIKAVRLNKHRTVSSVLCCFSFLLLLLLSFFHSIIPAFSAFFSCSPVSEANEFILFSQE